MPLDLNKNGTIGFRMRYDIPGETTYDFDLRLQYSGTDFTVYANNVLDGKVDIDKKRVTPVLQQILLLLFNDRSGVDSVRVRPFQLVIHRSTAVPVAKITEMIERGINRAEWNAAELP